MGVSEPDDLPRRYEVAFSDRAAEDRERAYLYLAWFLGPDFVDGWDTALGRVIAQLGEFPGPRANPVDEEVSLIFGRETRRLLFAGTRSHRLRTAYRVLYVVIEPAQGEAEGAIRVLRILHGSQVLVHPAQDE